MKQEYNYIETSIWYKDEIADPDQIIAEFFSAAGLDANRKIIRNLLFAANSTKMYNKDTPGDLLFHMQLFESLINAAYLINQQKRKSPLEIPNYDLFNPNLFRGWGRDTTDWEFIPHSLTLKEYVNPYVVFKRFFNFKELRSGRAICVKFSAMRWERIAFLKPGPILTACQFTCI